MRGGRVRKTGAAKLRKDEVLPPSRLVLDGAGPSLGAQIF